MNTEIQNTETPAVPTPIPYRDCPVLSRSQRITTREHPNITAYLFDLKSTTRYNPSTTAILLTFKDQPYVVSGIASLVHMKPLDFINVCAYADPVVALDAILPELKGYAYIPENDGVVSPESGGQKKLRKSKLATHDYASAQKWVPYEEGKPIFVDYELDIVLGGFISSGIEFIDHVVSNPKITNSVEDKISLNHSKRKESLVKYVAKMISIV